MTKRVGLWPVDEEVAGLLGGPGACRVGGDAGEVDVAGAESDEEQYVNATLQDRVDGEEVRRHDGLGLRGDERRPRRPRPVGNRWPSGVAQDLPDGGGGEAMAKLVQFAVDAPVTPGRALVYEA